MFELHIFEMKILKTPFRKKRHSHKHLAAIGNIAKMCLFCYAPTQKLNKLLTWNKKHIQDRRFVFLYLVLYLNIFFGNEQWRHFRSGVTILRKTTVFGGFYSAIIKNNRIIEFWKFDMKMPLLKNGTIFLKETFKTSLILWEGGYSLLIMPGAVKRNIKAESFPFFLMSHNWINCNEQMFYFVLILFKSQQMISILIDVLLF